MYTIKVSWYGGPEWDPNAASMFDHEKKKTPVEHLIEHGWQTLEETFENYTYFKSAPITLLQEKGSSNLNCNWVTTLVIGETQYDEATRLKNEIVALYEKKKLELETGSSPFSLIIEVNSH